MSFQDKVVVTGAGSGVGRAVEPHHRLTEPILMRTPRRPE